MTLKTSWFDSGIYKNTLKRFKWGSILYAVILFFSVPFILMVQNYDRYVLYLPANGRDLSRMILRADYLMFPTLFAIVVPTVVAALVYNFVHSPKQGIAVHALPVARKKNYISSLAAAVTLMGLPVLINSIILLLMSAFGFGTFISPAAVIYWFFMNISIQLMMFSVATVAAFLTGHTAAYIGINAFVHILPMLIALAIQLVSDVFLYGFVQADNFIAERILEYTPVAWIFSNINRLGEDMKFFSGAFFAYAAGAVVLYALGYLLYKKRKIESCGDVAAFKVFRPILKYSVTAAVAVVMFGILESMEIGAFPTIACIAVLAAIAYFACEMLMNKTFKVFHLYKGFLVFAAATAAVTLFFAYTSVFGYETRVPAKEDIVKASVYVNYRYEYPLIADEKVINDTISIHNELISDIPVVSEPLYMDGYSFVRVMYQLKNGEYFERRYPVKIEDRDKYLAKMYESEKYKYKILGTDDLNIENVRYLTLSVDGVNFDYSVAMNEEAKELLYAIEEDIKTLTYEQLVKEHYEMGMSVHINHTIKENREYNIFKNIGLQGYTEEDDEHMLLSFDLAIDSNFKNAFAYLDEKGYLPTIKNRIAESLYICKEPYKVEENLNGVQYSMKEDIGYSYEFNVSTDDLVKLSQEDALMLTDSILYTLIKEQSESGEYYAVFCTQSGNSSSIWFDSKAISYKIDELPSWLLKYIS